MIDTALISVYDKTGVAYLASELVKFNPKIRIISSGGTYSRLKEVVAGNLVEVSHYTGFPEMPGGLVKTLHPKIHCGILGSTEEAGFMQEHGISPIGLVVVNLYPFRSAASMPRASVEDVRLNIDIGGVSLIEAACKNFRNVCVLVDPADYEPFLTALRKDAVDLRFRLKQCRLGLRHLKAYLSEISEYFDKLPDSRVLEEYGG